MATSLWLLSITLLSGLLIAVKAAEWQGLYNHPEHPGKCTINPKLILDPGVSIARLPSNCVRNQRQGCVPQLRSQRPATTLPLWGLHESGAALPIRTLLCDKAGRSENCHSIFQKTHYKMLNSKTLYLFGLLWSLGLLKARADMSLNNYSDPAYPDLCVIDDGKSVILLKAGEAFRLINLPCVTIFCIGNGWGSLFTCEEAAPPKDCYFSHYLKWDAHYPDCCKRKVVCY